MTDREGADLVVAAIDRVARLQFDRLDRVGEVAEDAPEHAEQLAEPGPGRGPCENVTAAEGEAA